MGAAASCRKGNRGQKMKPKSSGAAISPHSCLNINEATEEELMTLPGINRTLAQSITAHRQKIGGFRRVEDLALVTGVGAEGMLDLQPEICVEKAIESNPSGTVSDAASATDGECNPVQGSFTNGRVIS
ncbi:endonuclease/exonuclease/phosphatase family domain-containing protein 1-like [Spea bombifrons]|uniref:endonuclease/exonuclease/phosphatase family domain-containing protein 1-like n=1 Tax=Spea bombifrons TaxID=233779 RepID=UPI00234AC1EC|nr:endonuclease/exonuclease/phosphatase family domain-containing protein 1-like [Spea bombifrons]